MPSKKNEEKTNNKMIFGSKLENINDLILSYKSLGHIFLDKLTNQQANKTILVDAASGRRWTGAEMNEKIMNIASALIDKHDFKIGTTVCISYDHSDISCLLALGIIYAGGIVACSYPKDPYSELLYLSRKTEPKFLFCDEQNFHWAEKLKYDLNYDIIAVAMGQKRTSTEAKYHINDYLNYDYKTSECLDRIPVSCDDMTKHVAIITMSSGTTGKPKAIPVTHFNCCSDLLALNSKTAGTINFACSSSLDYCSGRLIVFGAIKSGYTVIIINVFDPKTYLEYIEKYSINIIYIGAASFYSLITYKDVDKYDLSSVKVVFPMGAKVIYIDELREFLHKHPSIIQIRQGFGASETSGVSMNSKTPEEYLASPNNEDCGKLLDGVLAKIVDRKTGKTLTHNKQGILHLKSASVFPGYYDLEEVRKRQKSLVSNDCDSSELLSPFIRDSQVFDEDGFYITGDLAYITDNNHLYIIGRMKELMHCRGAKKVLPQELEELIMEHEAVAKVCVIGIDNKREKSLHCPRAFIVPKSIYNDDLTNMQAQIVTMKTNNNEDDSLKYIGNNKLCRLSKDKRHKLAEDIMSFVNDRIGWEKQLTGGIVLLDDIPVLKSTGKFNKTYLRSLSLDYIEIYGDQSE